MHIIKIITVILHREKCSVLPASALALSTALLTAKRTEELRAIGGSPTASKQKQKDNELHAKVQNRIDICTRLTHCSLALSKLNFERVTKYVSNSVSSGVPMLTYSEPPDFEIRALPEAGV